MRHRGRDHLVCPDPRRGWLRNPRADPVAALATRHTSITVTAVELDAERGAAVVQT